MKRSPSGWLVGLILVASASAGVAGPLNVIIAADMNAAGRVIQHPSPENPAYYIGVFRGYTDQGKKWGNGDPYPQSVPANEAVKKLVTETLAAQGYLSAIIDAPVDPKASPAAAHRQRMVGVPSLLLNIQWGYLSNRTMKIPKHYQIVVQGVGGPLVTGFTFNSNPDPSPEQIELIGAQKILNPGTFLDAALECYYVVVEAFDYPVYQQKKKLVLLWKTRLSVPAFGNTLAGTLPVLLAAGGPSFGQDLKLPVNVTAEVLPPGKVIIGKAVVIGTAK